MSHLGAGLTSYMYDWVEENLPGGAGNEINQMLMYSEDMRAFAQIMHYSVYGDYYLSQRYADGTPRKDITFTIYETNPSENHTFSLQRDIDRFLQPGADRAGILAELEDDRAGQVAHILPPAQPIPLFRALAFAAE